MTHDVIALVRGAPDIQEVVSALLAGGEQFRAEQAGTATRLTGPDGVPLISIEQPRYIEVPGEIERLAGPGVASEVSVPIWWVETRAASARPGADALAVRFAQALAGRQGGAVWVPPVPERASAKNAGRTPQQGAGTGSSTGPQAAHEYEPPWGGNEYGPGGEAEGITP